MRDLAALGMAVLLVEYPGYGFSEGKPSRNTIRETLQVAYDHLANLPIVDRNRMVIWGRSLGGGAAGDLIMDRAAAAFILQSTFQKS